MRYLKSYNESNNRLDGFINDLTKELEHIGFDLTHSYENDEGCLEINKDYETYIDFDLSYFSINELKKKCNEIIDDDKSSWPCDDVIKDDYDFLCTSILVFITNNMKHIKTYKIFEDVDKDIIQNCKDILLELNDDGFYTSVKEHREKAFGNRYYSECIIIRIVREKIFTKNMVEEYVMRLIDYLESEGFNHDFDWNKLLIEYNPVSNCRTLDLVFKSTKEIAWHKI